MISVGNLSILSDFWPKCSTAVSMATAMQMDERIVDYLVLGPNTQDRKVSAKSVTMRATALCKNLSGYRELLLTSLIGLKMPQWVRDILGVSVLLPCLVFFLNDNRIKICCKLSPLYLSSKMYQE